MGLRFLVICAALGTFMVGTACAMCVPSPAVHLDLLGVMM